MQVALTTYEFDMYALLPQHLLPCLPCNSVSSNSQDSVDLQGFLHDCILDELVSQSLLAKISLAMPLLTIRKSLRILAPAVILYLIYAATVEQWETILPSWVTSDHGIIPPWQDPSYDAIKAPLKNNSHLAYLPDNIWRFDGDDHEDPNDLGLSIRKSLAPAALRVLTNCPIEPNRYTRHIRLPNILYNISMESPKGAETQRYWNPTIIAQPYWAKNQYLMVSMVQTSEPYRKNVICEANLCHPVSQESGISREKICTQEDLRLLGDNGGLRCVTKPTLIVLPPTTSKICEGNQQILADIPGFHDPRLYYSGRGEPLLMVLSQSQYACVGLRVIDARAVYPSISKAFSSSPKRLSAPVMSYDQLTELTRTPISTRRSYEKNWMVFSPSPQESYLQYEIDSKKRTFAKLIGNGLTTSNMTDPSEEPCLSDPSVEDLASGHYFAGSSWHQATPSLKLVLCERSDTACTKGSPDTVFFAAIHRKHINGYGLPVRYERYFIVWSATAPFNMLAVSQHPILFTNESSRGWTGEEIWDDVRGGLKRAPTMEEWDYFTYTTTIAWAWSRLEVDVQEKNTGYLDDEVILSLGINDQGGLYGKVLARDLLQCLKICPRRG